jgi:hypothetical protein
MTIGEKASNLRYELMGGYLKEYAWEEAWQKFWDGLTPDEKNIIKKMPNFDKNKSKEITGIAVE